MNKLLALSLMTTLSLTACAQELPKPGSGITIKSLKEIDEKAYSSFVRYKQNQSVYAMECNGCSGDDDEGNEAKTLIDDVELVNVNLDTYFLNTKPEETEIRKNLNQLKLNFNYKKIEDNKDIKTTGFAPSNQYTKSGWTGVVQFFKHASLGHCSYEKICYDMRKGAVWIPFERHSQLVNNHPTMIYNAGNEKYGYVYSVSWYEDSFTNELKCANKKSDEAISINVVKLAKEINKNETK